MLQGACKLAGWVGVEPFLWTCWGTEGTSPGPLGAVPPIRWESRQSLGEGVVIEGEGS